ncbi:hypothetical protein D3C86_1687500 [compost metagenome]
MSTRVAKYAALFASVSFQNASVSGCGLEPGSKFKLRENVPRRFLSMSNTALAKLSIEESPGTRPFASISVLT